jgi:hypothetical protein
MLEVDKNFISTAILTIRQYIGPAFTYSVAKKLIKLRSDLTKEEKLDCRKQSEDVLNNYEGPIGETSSFFQKINSKIKKNDKYKLFIKLTESQIKFGNNIENDNQDVWNTGYNNETSDLEEEAKNIEMNTENNKYFINTNLKYFLNDSIDEDDEEEEEEDDIDDDDELIEDKEEDSRIDCEGFFHLKSGSTYKKHYYQVKNYGLYWFDVQNATKPKNKLSLKEAKLLNLESKPNEFSLKLKEKNVEKEYKFKCNNEQEKSNLIKAMTKAINNSKKETNGIQMETIEIKERKKVIKDYLNENNKIDIHYIEDTIFEYVKSGKYFQINKQKMEKQIKINKEKKKKEKERDKEAEKEKNQIKILRRSIASTKKKKTFKSRIKGIFKIKKKKDKKDKKDN